MLVRTVFVLLSMILGLWALPTAANAQYPDKPLKFVVPWPPGGAADIMARLIADRLAKEFGQPVVVDNRPGAGGLMATEQVARMPPDGYTLLLGSTGPNAIAAGLYQNLRYDPLKDLTHVTQITDLPLLLVVSKELPVNSVGELIAYAKANPGKLNFASVGAGTAQHLASEIFKLAAGIDIVHVPYKSSPLAMNDIVGNHVDFMFLDSAAAVPYMRGGKAKALAVTSARQVESFPDLPTMQELGFRDFEMAGWTALFLPKGAPREIVERLNKVFRDFMATGDAREFMHRSGGFFAPGTPEELTAWVRTELARWKEIVTIAGIQPE